MITVLPFRHYDPALMGAGAIPPDKLPLLEQSFSFTIVDERRRVLMCAGAFPDDDGIWWGWALLSAHAKHRAVALTRAVLFILQRMPSDSVRVAVDSPSMRRWVEMMGFSPAHPKLIGNRVFNTYERDVRHGA